MHTSGVGWEPASLPKAWTLWSESGNELPGGQRSGLHLLSSVVSHQPSSTTPHWVFLDLTGPPAPGPHALGLWP